MKIIKVEAPSDASTISDESVSRPETTVAIVPPGPIIRSGPWAPQSIFPPGTTVVLSIPEMRADNAEEIKPKLQAINRFLNLLKGTDKKEAFRRELAQVKDYSKAFHLMFGCNSTHSSIATSSSGSSELTADESASPITNALPDTPDTKSWKKREEWGRKFVEKYKKIIASTSNAEKKLDQAQVDEAIKHIVPIARPRRSLWIPPTAPRSLSNFINEQHARFPGSALYAEAAQRIAGPNSISPPLLPPRFEAVNSPDSAAEKVIDPMVLLEKLKELQLNAREITTIIEELTTCYNYKKLEIKLLANPELRERIKRLVQSIQVELQVPDMRLLQELQLEPICRDIRALQIGN